MRKAKIIESILKTQDSAFRNLVTLKLNLHNDITPARGESKSAYSIIETKSRFIKKFDWTEVDWSCKKKKLLKGDKLTIVASNPNFHHDISTVVESEVKTIDVMKHIVRILSSNESLDNTQCKFNVKIFSISNGRSRSKIINLSNDI